MVRHCFRPMIALYPAFMLACITHFATSEELVGPPSTNRLEIARDSDEYAEAVLTANVPKTFGIGLRDHERITAILATTKEMVDTARMLVQDERTLDQGRDLLERANALFRDVKEHIIRQREMFVSGQKDQTDLLRKNLSDHDIERAAEDEKRALDVARRIYETMITFPECIERLLEECLDLINADIGRLGLSTIEVVVHDKRNANQEGYNKVVIITNDLADKVKGRAGDGIVSYPFLWDDPAQGPRTLGVDGKWNCHDLTPEACCNNVKLGVSQDTRGKDIECHIFVPFGGVGNPRRNDRVFIKLSPDGRVHEAPIIQ